jgi:Tfp pilus assembly protein PilF
MSLVRAGYICLYTSHKNEFLAKMKQKILLALTFLVVIASYPAALASPAESDIKQAEALIEQGEYKAALSQLDLIIQNNQSIAQAYAVRARAYDYLGQSEKAIEDYTKAISLDPNNAAAYVGRAKAYERSGKADRALRDQDKAKELGYKPEQN